MEDINTHLLFTVSQLCHQSKLSQYWTEDEQDIKPELGLLYLALQQPRHTSPTKTNCEPSLPKNLIDPNCSLLEGWSLPAIGTTAVAHSGDLYNCQFRTKGPWPSCVHRQLRDWGDFLMISEGKTTVHTKLESSIYENRLSHSIYDS